MKPETLKKFQDMTDKLMVDKHHSIDPIIEHSIDGISSEAGELADAAKRVKWYGTEIDTTNILEECGDLLFYLDKLIRRCNSTFEGVMQMNMSKLAERYKNFEFTKDQAVNRDVDKEREILETNIKHKPYRCCSTCVKRNKESGCTKHVKTSNDGCCLGHKFSYEVL